MSTPSSADKHTTPESQPNGAPRRRVRRRAMRRSDAEHIDRSVDSVRFYQRVTAGVVQPIATDRIVELDDEQPTGENSAGASPDPTQLTAEFWRENQPPHYGH